MADDVYKALLMSSFCEHGFHKIVAFGFPTDWPVGSCEPHEAVEGGGVVSLIFLGFLKC